MTENLRAFPWQAFKVLCQGISIIDTPKLELKDESEAYQFILAYGYDLFKANHLEQVWNFHEEACDFLETKICKPQEAIPKMLRHRDDLQDLRKILLTASNVEVRGLTPVSIYRPWACAILRVMHTLAHFQNDLRLKYLPKIRRQTLERLEAHIQRVKEDGEERLYLGYEKDKVPLVSFKKKESKFKESTLLKLLHKPQNVAQQIYDHIGVRFITRTRLDAVRVMRYLIEHHLIAVANIMPSRCRNNLIEVEELEAFMSASTDVFAHPDVYESKLKFPESLDKENPFSSSDYRSIQFTSRHLIRIPMKRKGMNAEASFFFPLEVQITDKDSYKLVESGDAHHLLYKEKQLEVVRERVLKGVL